jgi:hypothetical protein
MSAIEVINEVQELPLQEQEQVLDFLQKKLRLCKSDRGDVKHATDADFEKAADKVFRENRELLSALAK